MGTGALDRRSACLGLTLLPLPSSQETIPYLLPLFRLCPLLGYLHEHLVHVSRAKNWKNGGMSLLVLAHANALNAVIWSFAKHKRGADTSGENIFNKVREVD
ncbi:hypothetical protein SAMN05660745_00155 [Corynebacterium glucuronolyticum]|nr:hypothetical protein SAMN05660745_00155 [Corynebacterium glucuronolyticum]